MSNHSAPKSTATPYVLKKYKPKPRDQREGIGLCLSGGGYRALLFHLGALRRLNELGFLEKLKTISAVSGGSIIAAHLAISIPWPLNERLSDADWEQLVADPLRAFVKKNIRTVPILKRLLLPWNWVRERTQVETLEKRYRRNLTSKKLTSLPDKPKFIFSATDMAFGVNWIFEQTRMGDYKVGYISPPPDHWPISRAVAASSCFPPVFDPLPVPKKLLQFAKGGSEQGSDRQAAINDLRLTDGGAYDNLGLEPVWKDHEIVISSDGGETFDPEADKNPLWRLTRYISIVQNQAQSVRKRWLISNFLSGELDGVYWGIGSATENYGPGTPVGYSKKLAQKVIAEVRTDLDAFSEAEAAVLENHGYLLANAACRQHLPGFFPSPIPDIKIPHEDWMDEAKVKSALAQSHKVKLLGRW